jgi:hypothetical protein
MSETASNVVYLKQPKRFTLSEAQALLPAVKEITQKAVEEATPTVLELQRPDLTEEERIEYGLDLEKMANRWGEEISRLGAVPKGLWLVDFDSGTGYYCWRYNEPELAFFHTYDDGFSGRTPIQ